MSIQLTFHQDLYSEQAVRDSAAAFASLATFGVAATAGSIEVTLTDIREDARSAIEDEFCNHVLAGTIRSRRASTSSPAAG